MSDELNPTIIKRTQDTLGKFVKKPQLTDKLLKKPPFRFLHDVFGVIIRDTGCFVGLYSAEELTYENIKDRDDKIKFLQKMIDVVKLTTGSNLTIKTSKIVAGHEPEKTNELLQLMGEIIGNKLGWQKAVEEVLSGKITQKDSQRRSKDTSNKITKDTKSKDKRSEKPKESKESRAIEPKKSKVTGSKLAAATTAANKDDKTKISKTKDNTSRQLNPTKEKALKTGKETEKFIKKSSIGSSNMKAKLKKSDSHSSNKSSPSPKIQEQTKEQQNSDKNETDCGHEQIEQQKESPKIVTTPAKLPHNGANNENLKSKEDSVDNQKNPSQLSHLEAEVLTKEKPKKSSSAKPRNSSASKPVPAFGEQVDDTENTTNLDTAKSSTPSQEKSEISEAGIMSSLKQDASSIQEPRKLQKPLEPDATKSNLQEPPISMPQKPIEKTPQAAPPAVLNNEIKRESTFTRESSIDSNKSSLANRPRTSLRPPSARPPSARPGAPRRRDKNIEIVLQPNDQIKMSGIQVKLETFDDLHDDEENLVIIENPDANDTAIDRQSNLMENEHMTQDETLEQGHLVQQILETQKELVQQQNDASIQQKNDKDSSNNSVMRQTSAHHMNNLRDVIQNITKSVNPLGKLMDFIPEDIDAMQLEFSLWRDTYTQAANELKREKSLTESATEPMKNQLVKIEANIGEYMEMINASRVKILQNAEKITKMLTKT